MSETTASRGHELEVRQTLELIQSRVQNYGTDFVAVRELNLPDTCLTQQPQAMWDDGGFLGGLKIRDTYSSNGDWVDPAFANEVIHWSDDSWFLRLEDNLLHPGSNAPSWQLSRFEGSLESFDEPVQAALLQYLERKSLQIEQGIQTGLYEPQSTRNLRAIHVIGPMLGGKDTLERALSTLLHAPAFHFSHTVKEAMSGRLFGFDFDYTGLRDESQFWDHWLESTLRPTYIALHGLESAARRYPEDSLLILNGARRKPDVKVPQFLCADIITLYLDATEAVREKRAIGRMRDIDPEDLDQLRAAMAYDLRACESCKGLPDVDIIENNGTFEEMLPKVLTKLKDRGFLPPAE